MSTSAVALFCTFVCIILGSIFAVLFATQRKTLVNGVVLTFLNCTLDCNWLPREGRICINVTTLLVGWSYNGTNYTEPTEAPPFVCSDCCESTVGKPLQVQLDTAAPGQYIALWPENEWTYRTGFEALMITFFVFAFLGLIWAACSVCSKRVASDDSDEKAALNAKINRV